MMPFASSQPAVAVKAAFLNRPDYFESRVLPPTCDMAFKEWAVICQSLATGQQTIILRKGGIHEGRAGFRVAHQHFWLFPTWLHQEKRDQLIESAWPTLDAEIATRPDPDRIRLELLAEVTDVIEIFDETLLPKLAGLHWWSAQTLQDRFHYRHPGLFLLVTRLYHAAKPVELLNSPHFAGCRSWVDLPQPFSTAGLRPVLSDVQFRTNRAEVINRLAAQPA